VNRRVAFRPQAEAEVLEARAWYEDRRAGLGTTFATAVETTVEEIVRTPLAVPHVSGDMRRAVLRRFPYAIYFRASAGEILIVAVMHDRRHPRRWQSRR